jgi:uncharacterized protein YdcH (DUF465 family)
MSKVQICNTDKIYDHYNKIDDHIEEYGNKIQTLYNDKIKSDKIFEERLINKSKIITLLESSSNDDLNKLYQLGIISPPMETHKQLREAYWKHYPESYISEFGEHISVEYYNYLELFPHQFNIRDPKSYKWNREDVKKFVEGVPDAVLYGLGY